MMLLVMLILYSLRCLFATQHVLVLVVADERGLEGFLTAQGSSIFPDIVLDFFSVLDGEILGPEPAFPGHFEVGLGNGLFVEVSTVVLLFLFEQNFLEGGKPIGFSAKIFRSKGGF